MQTTTVAKIAVQLTLVMVLMTPVKSPALLEMIGLEKISKFAAENETLLMFTEMVATLKMQLDRLMDQLAVAKETYILVQEVKAISENTDYLKDQLRRVEVFARKRLEDDALDFLAEGLVDENDYDSIVKKFMDDAANAAIAGINQGTNYQLAYMNQCQEAADRDEIDIKLCQNKFMAQQRSYQEEILAKLKDIAEEGMRASNTSIPNNESSRIAAENLASINWQMTQKTLREVAKEEQQQAIIKEMSDRTITTFEHMSSVFERSEP